MSRLESIAIGGYYPLPPELAPVIGSWLRYQGAFVTVDPCAGDGAAVLGIRDALCVQPSTPAKHRHPLFTIEMEATRYAALREALSPVYNDTLCALHGDAFCAEWENAAEDGAGLLYLNPPYDQDPEFKRLEERWLRRFGGVLCPGGVLVLVVPARAVPASIETLSREYVDVRVLAFPEPDYAAFSQVVVFARRRGAVLPAPDPAQVLEIEAGLAAAAAHEPGAVLVQCLGEGPYRVRAMTGKSSSCLSGWKMRPVDFRELLQAYRPWIMSTRWGQEERVPGVCPQDATKSLWQEYRLGTPPKPAHIAAGLAAGIFNGEQILPNDPASPLPPLLVKGVFEKQWKTVDHKTNKDGDVVGEIQKETPKLVTTVLDLRDKCFVTMRNSVEVTGAEAVGAMTMGDLIEEYGVGLMATMRKRCPVLHDPTNPAHEISLAPLERSYFQAQAHTAMALVKMLGGAGVPYRERMGLAAYLLGEIGTGKTQVALGTALTVGAHSILVMCPPHLLTGWQEQVQAVCPWVQCTVLRDVADVEAYAAQEYSGTRLAILSREAAKLGHAWTGVARSCPTCGAPVPDGDLGKSRARCKAKPVAITGELGGMLLTLARALIPVFPEHPMIQELARTHAEARYRALAAKAMSEADDPVAWSLARWRRVLGTGTVQWLAWVLARNDLRSPLKALLCAFPEPSLILEVAETMLDMDEASGDSYTRRRWIGDILHLVNTPEVRETAKRLDSERWAKEHAELWQGQTPVGWAWDRSTTLRREAEGTLRFGERVVGDHRNILEVLGKLAPNHLDEGEECGEILYCAIPSPRRYPLASLIQRRYKNLFDFLILDELHELATAGSAQEHAAHRLMGLGHPTLLLSGTVMNGYADSLFTHAWAASPAFRAQFDRDDVSAFMDVYGYRKRVVEQKVKSEVRRGRVTDRVETSIRITGKAPGVLPLFLFQHLLGQAATLHKSDLELALPECVELPHPLTGQPDQLQAYKALEHKLVEQIQADMFTPLMGKLWGAMTELPSYLDRCTLDVGNQDDGSYAIYYPESVGGQHVVTATSFPAHAILPKEEWMLAKIKETVAEGRNALILAWHTALLPRLARLIHEHLDLDAPILDPAKVPTRVRQDWINENVLAKKRRVLLSNPVAVQTGLNNLVWFATQLWMENPACNPLVYRQTVGRADRIGQDQDTRIFFPYYTGTLQVQMFQLLLHKVGVSMTVDGLDARAALEAAGVGEGDGMSSLAVGKQLYKILTEGSPFLGRAA